MNRLAITDVDRMKKQHLHNRKSVFILIYLKLFRLISDHFAVFADFALSPSTMCLRISNVSIRRPSTCVTVMS